MSSVSRCNREVRSDAVTGMRTSLSVVALMVGAALAAPQVYAAEAVA